MNLIEELRWRGMIKNIKPGTKEQLGKEMTVGYIGFDPTANSLHIGSLVPILLLVHFQKAGHKPIALVGGATGMIGDPSGKSEERNLLSEEELNKNIAGVKTQLEKFLDFDPSKPNAAEIANNYDWFKEISFIDFLRDAGKHITVSYMMAKESVKKRIKSGSGMSYTEFAYQLMQGYDFYWLYKHKNCKLQMGGSDQWGNMTTGTELIRRKANGEGFVFTNPLIKKADGGKFGKTESGNIWLDAGKTSVYQFYQFWLNASDRDARKWIKIFTFLTKKEIDRLIRLHRKNQNDRILQKKLAEEITGFVHGQLSASTTITTTQQFFQDKTASVDNLTEETLINMAGSSIYNFELLKIKTGIDVVSFLAETNIFLSKGDARKTIQGGGISINRKKVDDIQMRIDSTLLLHDQYILIQKGKKNYYLVKAI